MQKSLSNSGKFLSSKVSLLLTFLWLANDHIWKREFHNEITGKLSDITGLIVFPFLLTTISFHGSFKKLNEKFLFLFANISIATLFSIINWNQDWNDWIYANCFGNQNGFADRTDLFCIPFCLCANFFFYTKFSKIEITLSTRFFFLQLIAIILSTLAFTNTSIIDPNMHLKKTKLNAKVQKN
ncbi:MAG: hypothetical protein KBF99_09680 [Leptospiraceae bacterium]|nr:hypothetical protein [Leptospiraceae bacterium]MBK7053710.1 hypothetical protein [Leptospiraceae bacterium]MBK9500165.1 hypothetical protein [Leptospiraceae bacterium]MBL0264284.1 hypothetical protein [Leptospiraceae bacterium]MBP9163442.1 hypothetical protein [Leptospiraceae bacterium]